MLLGVCLTAPFLLVGCGGDEGVPQTFPPLRYTYLAPISLNVANIQTEVDYAPAADGSSLDSMSPETPLQAVQQMIQDRLVAAGGGGTATIMINSASINRVNDTAVGNISLRLTVTSADGHRTGYTDANVTRTRTLPDDTSDAALRAFLYSMTQDMVNAENVELEYQIRQNLAAWLVGGGSAVIGGPAAPTPVQAEPLGGPGSVAPVTGAPTPLGAPQPLGAPAPTSPAPASPAPASLSAPAYQPAVPAYQPAVPAYQPAVPATMPPSGMPQPLGAPPSAAPAVAPTMPTNLPEQQPDTGQPDTMPGSDLGMPQGNPVPPDTSLPPETPPGSPVPLTPTPGVSPSPAEQLVPSQPPAAAPATPAPPPAPAPATPPASTNPNSLPPLPPTITP
jgi:hypothetical protein